MAHNWRYMNRFELHRTLGRYAERYGLACLRRQHRRAKLAWKKMERLEARIAAQTSLEQGTLEERE